MTDELTVVEINCTTGEVIERPMTAEEISSQQAAAVEAEARRAVEEAEAAAKAAAKQSAQEKLKALGLTDIEILAIAGI